MLNSVSGGDHSFYSTAHYIFDNSVSVLRGIYKATNDLTSAVCESRSSGL